MDFRLFYIEKISTFANGVIVKPGLRGKILIKKTSYDNIANKRRKLLRYYQMAPK